MQSKKFQTIINNYNGNVCSSLPRHYYYSMGILMDLTSKTDFNGKLHNVKNNIMYVLFSPRNSGYSFVLTCYSWSLAFFSLLQIKYIKAP